MQIIRANGFDNHLVDTDVMPKFLAIQAEIALDKGDASRAEALFSAASFLAHPKQEEDDEPKKDELAETRLRFPQIGSKTMVVTADALAALRGKCVQYKSDFPLFVMDELEENLQTLKDAQTVMALDALLTHGNLKVGHYLTRGGIAIQDSDDRNACQSATTRNVNVTEADIQQVRQLAMMAEITALIPTRGTMDDFPPAVTAHLADALAAFFEHAQLQPGRYEMNKTLKQVKLRIGF
jgi:hypothetical protein